MSTPPTTPPIQLRNLSKDPDPEGEGAAYEGPSKDPLMLFPKIQSDEQIEGVKHRKGKGMTRKKNKQLATFYEAQNEVPSLPINPNEKYLIRLTLCVGLGVENSISKTC